MGVGDHRRGGSGWGCGSGGWCSRRRSWRLRKRKVRETQNQSKQHVCGFHGYFVQIALRANDWFSTPMMPTKLTAKPMSTMTRRPDVLEVALTLNTLIRKPSSVMTTPAIAISLSPQLKSLRSRFKQSGGLLLPLLQRLNLQKQSGRDAQQDE